MADDSLEPLATAGVDVSRLGAGIDMLRERHTFLDCGVSRHVVEIDRAVSIVFGRASPPSPEVRDVPC